MAVLAWFVVSATTDWLSVAWQSAREKKLAGRAAGLAVLLEALGWAPLLFVWQTGQWEILAGCLAGSWVGSYLAIRRSHDMARRD